MAVDEVLERCWERVGGGEDEDEVPVGVLGEEGGEGGVCWRIIQRMTREMVRGVKGVARRVVRKVGMVVGGVRERRWRVQIGIAELVRVVLGLEIGLWGLGVLGG